MSVLVVLSVIGLAFVSEAAVQAQTRRDSDRVERRIGLFDRAGSSIGVEIRDPDKAEIAKAKIPTAGGAFIGKVQEGGPAAKAGLQSGDVVIEFDGERVRSARHFSRLVEEPPDGRTVKATIARDEARKTLEITPELGKRHMAGSMLPDDIIPNVQREVEHGLRALPRDFDLHIEGPAIGIAPRGRLGVNVEPLSDQLAEFFGTTKGVLVSSVEPDSPAAKAGLKAGDVITSVNGRTVDDPQALSAAVRTAESGATLEIGIVRDKKPASLKALAPDVPARRLARHARPI